MVATLAGSGALLLGLALMLLPLLATELSRPGDSAWGALVLVLALVLVTSADRLTGSPMLAVISGGLLTGRLMVEVGRGRWRQLTAEEKARLGSWERWRASTSEAGAALRGLVEAASQKSTVVVSWWRERRQPKPTGKRWVRPGNDTPAAAPADLPPTEIVETRSELAAIGDPAVVEVSDFQEIDALLQAAPAITPPEDSGDREPPAGGAG